MHRMSRHRMSLRRRRVSEGHDPARVVPRGCIDPRPELSEHDAVARPDDQDMVITMDVPRALQSQFQHPIKGDDQNSIVYFDRVKRVTLVPRTVIPAVREHQPSNVVSLKPLAYRPRLVRARLGVHRISFAAGRVAPGRGRWQLSRVPASTSCAAQPATGGPDRTVASRRREPDSAAGVPVRARRRKNVPGWVFHISNPPCRSIRRRAPQPGAPRNSSVDGFQSVSPSLFITSRTYRSPGFTSTFQTFAPSQDLESTNRDVGGA